ncbi:ABC transporter ATP-binding protein [Mycoplasma sp. Mirounga ES2805-ORL]|uniref:ABC transporter ATP-binding protein n=1 Tax=Mycoplasma sp. Mirounga ES2805-ORL TaxID=754514 RepID=UPI00197B9AB9|nr:ABC transporter ATP-binding protein [Mycoplasma sp. Mirounga ES2805-ORL]QSF13502.1 ABC transporter ATP-binding protein [Mycoplasma sp. Mirounga ES2805-ORL]
MTKKTKKSKTSQISQDEQTLEKELSDNIEIVSFSREEKVSKKNIVDLLKEKTSKRNIALVPKPIKFIKSINKKKFPKDENKLLKNTEGNIIEVQNVSKYYVSNNIATRVLNDVSLSIKNGELILIYGISGGGKSTLLNLISGLDRPTKGNVIVCDNNLPYLTNSQLTKFRRNHVSFIFQSYNLLSNLSSYDNVMTGAYLQKDPERKVDIPDLFKKFNMQDEINKFPAQLSGGQQQRVSIMRALVKNTELVFADEPTGALDEDTTKMVLNVLWDLNKNNKTTVVMVSHNPGMAKMADRVITMRNGKVAKVDINTNPIHPDKLEL